MAKKGLGKFVMLAAAAGAAAAGISYFRKYQSFNKELDEDFHDFEDEEDTPVPDSTMTRNYVSLHADKDEFLVAAGDMLNAAKDVAGAAKNVMKDAAAIVADTERPWALLLTLPPASLLETAMKKISSKMRILFLPHPLKKPPKQTLLP